MGMQGWRLLAAQCRVVGASINTLRFVLTHPLNAGRPFNALGKFSRWQLACRLLPGKVAVPFVGPTRLLVGAGMTGATGNVYCGLHEFEDMAFVLHMLRPGDWFVDVGANVGAYSVLAAGVCGASVVACEPAPAAYEALMDNVRLNDLNALVVARNVAVGASVGTARFTDGLGTVNHVLPATGSREPQGITVSVDTLDNLLEGRSPAAIKIDVEGFEAEVIRGGRRTFRDPGLLAVLVELKGNGARYGFDEDLIRADLLAAGFVPSSYEPLKRELRLLSRRTGCSGNTLFVRDAAELRERVCSAQRFNVHGRSV